MSTEPTVNSSTPANTEPVSTTGTDVTKPAPDDASKHTNGDTHAAKPDGASHIPEESKSTDAPEPVDAAKSAEEPPSGGPVLATGVDSQQPAKEAKPDAPNAGDKREHEPTSASTDTDQPSTESSGPPTVAPAPKKQKTNDKAATENGTQANGEKKKAGRQNKAKEAVKKVVPTDGIGSRTRSRTKAAS
ncbi:hypothetical protein P170DRAFT_423652 [Aspergillus steynii IBT 23096]|uniref:Uncharacterized protein n=1 Tax=Aspergillus steynii IBT 23096 TaxID=1392250 RepID=A0A2I2GIX0_9EURO|nr:uncharacterized protein P170DRAFT_423652 [Aspergillus steynii IBT 23096]PLB52835.1 hypothetical protein P170DRAFT_423652 [Aspergillus steynii IBT 23096]